MDPVYRAVAPCHTDTIESLREGSHRLPLATRRVEGLHRIQAVVAVVAAALGYGQARLPAFQYSSRGRGSAAYRQTTRTGRRESGDSRRGGGHEEHRGILHSAAILYRCFPR